MVRLGCVLKVQLIGLADALIEGCERKAGPSDVSSATLLNRQWCHLPRWGDLEKK